MSANNSSGPVVNNNKKNDKQVDTHQAAQQHGTGVAANASQTQHAPGKLQQPAGQFDLAHRHKHADGTADDDKSIAHQAAPSGDDQASTAGADAGAPVASADGSAGAAGADAAASLGGTPDGSSDSGAAGGAAPAASSGVPTAVWVGLGALAIGGVAAGIALSGGHSDSSHDSGSGTNNSSGNKGTTLTGNVEDGLVAGAHIYIDVNGNGIPVAAGDTGVVTDASGHYSFTTTLTGAIIAVGGTNIDTGLPNTITLSAPAGSTVINPLTTLVQSYAAQNHVTTSVAEAAVAQGLGISSSVSLTTYDPYSAASGDTTALAVQKLAAEVATILTVAQSSAAQASGGTAESAVLSALTNLLSNSSGTVDLSQQATINALNQAAGGVLNVAEVQNILTANQAIGAATTLDTSSGNSVSHAQSANLSVQDETVAGAQTLLATNASAKYNLIDTAANLAAASATLGSHAVNVTVTSTATVAQAAVIHAFGNTGTTSYTITDTAANVLAGGATVSAATTVTVTDAFVTVAQASALAGLNAHVAIAAIHDTEANLLAAINSHAAALGDTSSFATTDAASLALSVHDAQTLLNAHVTITHGYSIVDTGAAINAAVANGASAVLGASALTTSDNAALALSLANAHTLHTDGITITHGYALNDTAQALTSAIAANDSAVLGATALTSSDSAAVVVDVAHLDSLGNAHITVTHGITLHDSASAILGAIENEDANLANAQTIATTDASAVTLSIGDEHALATANVTITHGYAISDTEQALLDAINGSDSAVAHATSLSTNDVDAVSISVDDANTLANAHVTITHGYVLNDANDALEAVIADPTSVAYGATALTTTDDSTLSLNVAQANTLLGTDGIVITNGFTIADTAAALSAALVDPDSPLYGANLITVTDDQPLTFTIAEIPTIMAHTGLFAEDTTYSLADTAGNLYAALNGDQGDFFSQLLQEAVAVTTTDDATLALTIAQADGLTLANITNGYTIADTEANLLAAIRSCDPSLDGAQGLVTTDADAVTLSVHDADRLAHAGVTITNGYTLADGAWALAHAIEHGDAVVAGAQSLSTTDASAVSLTVQAADALTGAGVDIVAGYNLSDRAANLLAAITNEDPVLGNAGAISTSDHSAITLTIANEHTLAANNVTITNGYTLSDDASVLLNAFTNEDAALTNAIAISTDDASAVTLSVDEANTLLGHSVTISNGYTLVDSEANLLAAINQGDNSAILGASGYATNDDGAVSLDLTDADTLLTLGVHITNGYTLSGSEADLLSAIENNDIAILSHPVSISTTDDGAVTLSLGDADTLLNADVTITNGYVLTGTASDIDAAIASNDIAITSNVVAITTICHQQLVLSVDQADTLVGTDGIVVTNGYTVADTAAAISAALADGDSPIYGAGLVTITDDQPLTFTIDALTTLAGHDVQFASQPAIIVADTAQNLYNALNGADGQDYELLLGQTAAITTTDEATLALTIAQADGLTLANITNGYTIADTEANLLAAIRSCDASLDGAQGLVTTDADAVTLSVHDADRLAHAGVTITNGYTLADGAWALAHAIEHGDAVVAGAQSLSTTDASAVSLTVQAADALTGAGVDIVAGYNLSDRAANLLAAITNEDPVLGNAGAISTSDHSAITLTIANEHTLAANHVTITNGYNLSDDASVLLNAFTNEDAALTNAIAISTDDASAVTLSVDEANTLLGHSVTISNGYTLVDSEANLLAAINQGDNSAILGASGYATNDDGAVSLDLTDADTLLTLGVHITNGYTLSGSEADLLSAIENNDIAILSHPLSISTTDDGAVTLSLGDADTLLNADVTITNGYVLTGTASDIDAAIASNDIAITSNVTAITTICDRQLVLSVAQADTLLNDGVTITNGYALHDTADHLLAALAHGNDPAILGTGSVEVTDQNLVLNVSDATTLYNDGVSYAHGYVLADNASALYNAIESNNAVIGQAGAITANDAAGAQLSVTEVDTLLDANVSFANSYTLFDSAANLADAILSDDPAVLGASTYVANDTSAATLSVQQADTLIGSNVALAHGYNLVDGSVELADAIINNDAAFSELTGSMTTNDSAALTVQQADALLNHSVTLSDGYSISDTAQNLLDAINDNDLSITSNPTSITTQDSGSLTLGVEQADALLNHGVTIAHGFTLVDSADDLLAAIAIHGDLAIGEAGSITDNDGTDLVLNATQAEALVHAGVTFENSFTLAGSLSDIEGALGAIGAQLTAAHATIEITDDNLVIPFADVAGLTAAGVQLPANYSVSGGTWDLLNAINGNNAIVSNASALVVNDGPMGLSLLQIDTLTSHNVTFQLGYGVWDTAQHILSAINGDTFGQYSDATSFATSDSNPVSLSVPGTDTLLDHGVTISHGVNLTDDASNLLAAIDNGDESLAHATAITTDDSSILTLSVNEANVALTHATITHGFDLYDTGVHIADALIADGAAVGDAFTISATDATGLTVAEADALIGANIQYSGNLTLADSLGNLELAILTVDLTALQAATSITVTDAETGSLSVSDAHALLQYNVSFQAGYDLVDSSQNLLDAAAGDSTDQAALLGASAIEANDSTLATLTVTQATTLEGLHVTFEHGYAVADTADNFYNAIQTNAFGVDGVFSGVQSIATTDDGPITLGVTEADALLEHGVTITNAFDLAGTATELLAADIETLTDARSITADDVDGVTLDAADAATLGHYNVSYEYGLTIDDSATNWVAALEGSNAADLHAAILSGSATIETNDDGPVTLDVADAKVLVDNGVLVTDGLVVEDSAQTIAELLATDGAFLTTSTIVSFVANDSSVVTLSVADVNVLAGASITIQHGYVLADTASALLDVIGNPMVSGARSVEVTDADPVLSVSDAESLLGIGATYERGYTLTGSATDLVAALTGDPALLASLTGVETTDTGVVTLSLADAQTLMNAHVSFVAGYAIADSADALLTAIANDTISGFDTAPASVATNDGSVDDLSVTQVQTLQGADVTITNGYHLVDTIAELAGATSQLIEGSTGGYSLSDGGSTLAGITVSELHVAQGADNFGDYTYSLTDSLENFEGALDGDIAGATGGYSLSDIAGSTFGNLTVSDAQLLTNASNYASNNYHYTVTDSLADIEAAASIAHNAQSYTLTDSNGTNFGNLSVANAELLTGASNFASGGYSFGIEDTFGDLLTNPGLLGLAEGGFYDTDAPGHMYGPLTVEQVQLLEQATNYQSATYEYSLTDSLSNLAAAPGIVAHALGYSLNNAAGNVGTLSAANASIVAGASNHASYSYAIQDSATDIGMVASTAVQGATGVTVTGTSTVTDATTVLALNSNTQVQTLQDTAAHIVANSGALSSHVGELIVVDPASVAQAVTINNIVVSAGREYAVVDSAANLSTGLYNWTTFSGVTSVTVLLSASTDLSRITLDTGVTSVSLNGQAVRMTDAELISLQLSGTGSIAEVLSANRDLTSVYNSTNVYALASLVTAVDLNGHNATLTSGELTMLGNGLTDSIGTGSVSEVLTGNISGALSNFVKSLDLNGYTATLSSTQLAGVTVSANTAGSIVEQLASSLDLTSSLDSHVTQINLEGHTVKLTDQELAAVTVSDSIGGGTIIEQLTGNVDLTHATLNSLIKTIDLDGHTATVTSAELSSLTFTDTSVAQSGALDVVLSGTLDFTSSLNSFVKAIDLNGHSLKLTDTELASSLSLSDSSVTHSGSVTEEFTNTTDLTSGNQHLSSHVTSLDLDGNTVALTDSQLAQVNYVNDTASGGTLSEQVTQSQANGSIVSLVNHSSALTFNLNLNNEVGTNATVTIAGLQHNDTLNVGSGTGSLTQVSVGTTLSANEYSFDTSSKTLTWDDNSGSIHAVVLANATNVALQQDQHTFKVI